MSSNSTLSSASMPTPTAYNVEDFFTKYPTQVGALYQWASSTNTRHAWSASNGVPVTLADDSPSGFWASLKATHEGCPYGYRRPICSDLTKNQPIYDPVNEITQSLGDNTTQLSGTTGIIHGLYADGYFDRLPKDLSGYYNQAKVRFNDSRVAYFGTLYIETNTAKSLFIPHANPRGYGYNSISESQFSQYWAVGSYSNFEGWGFSVRRNPTTDVQPNITYVRKRDARPVRCVVE